MDAADILYISQPTLSRHIKRIEEDLDVTLFIRNSRGLELTQEGKIFLPYAKQIVAIEKNYTNVFQKFKIEHQETLTIGTVPMMAPYGITDIFQRFSKAYPDIKLIVNVMPPREMLQALESDGCDFIFARELSKSENEYVWLPVTEDHMAVVVANKHPLAGTESVSLAQLKEEKMIFPLRDSEVYRVCLQSCRDAGFEPKISFTCQGPESAVDLVTRYMGVALLMRRPCEFMDVQSKASLIDIEPKIRAQIAVAYKPGDKSGAAQKFLSFLKRHL